MINNPRVQTIYYQAPSESTAECVIIELAGGQKAYARVWTGQLGDPCIEWGWQVHESAVKIYDSADTP